jgi:hypothetical protein
MYILYIHYVNMYIMYLCMYKYIYYVYIYNICMYVYVYILCIYVYIYICMNIYILLYIYVYVYIYICIYLYIYIWCNTWYNEALHSRLVRISRENHYNVIWFFLTIIFFFAAHVRLNSGEERGHDSARWAVAQKKRVLRAKKLSRKHLCQVCVCVCVLYSLSLSLSLYIYIYFPTLLLYILDYIHVLYYEWRVPSSMGPSA